MLTEGASDRVQSQPTARRVATGQGQLELELVKPIRAGDIA